jgi:phosphopantothenoylcysteine decarboxylase/phosphopantothenate--cysteine ligase
MERAMKAAAGKADVIIMAAAVADYRPAKPSAQKLKRDGKPLTVTFEPNPDILSGLGAGKRANQTVVGFALETNDGVENARRKLASKHADLIVLNTPSDGIGGETNVVTLVEARAAVELSQASKREVAEHILERVLELRGATARPALAMAGAAPVKAASKAAAPEPTTKPKPPSPPRAAKPAAKIVAFASARTKRAAAKGPSKKGSPKKGSPGKGSPGQGSK